MNAGRILIALLLAIFILSIACAGTPQRRIQEDDPRWNCKTMGNHICGNGVDYAP